MASATRQAVVSAYGGEERWSASKSVEAVVSAGGLAFLSKWQRGFRRLRVDANIALPRVKLSPFDSAGHPGLFDAEAVRVLNSQEKVLAERFSPRRAFPYGRRLLWWDRLDLLYFAGYTLWNYLTLPALLMRKDIEWTEVSPTLLEGRFPPHLPTHCEVQPFHFDPATRLLRQHDYTAEVFGTWAKAAHVVLEHRTWQGIPFAARRRVTPRRPDGQPRQAPTLVWIEVHEWRLV